MIRKLQRRFIVIALVALTAAMVAVVLIVNVANFLSVRQELEDTISFLLENEGNDVKGPAGGSFFARNKHARNLISESSWFSVFVDENGRRIMNLETMAEADADTAASLAASAEGKESGFLQDYLYRRVSLARGGTLTLFLNCETKLTAMKTLALLSLAACVGGILLAFLFVALASRRAVEPTIRRMEQQKQFITNASHELKTPITVISTNMELLQMEMPEENQWVRSTQKQTSQMRRLVDELVYLSRMEEENAPLQMEKLDLCALVSEVAAPFSDMAAFHGNELTLDLPSPLFMTGDRASLERLVSTLMDNAVKYAASGEIRVQAKAEGRNAVLSVSNMVAEPLTHEQCERLFQRFYRADDSRSKEKQGGFGIGLAIAAAIAEKHGGTISASMAEENRLCFVCRLPKASGKTGRRE
ncbi:MAG: HAMP domain-containing histidine kinase [Clostridia bacterium]|nr:HAMP domain-containing histidine kinase [Clostridia bacterium]